MQNRLTYYEIQVTYALRVHINTYFLYFNQMKWWKHKLDTTWYILIERGCESFIESFQGWFLRSLCHLPISWINKPSNYIYYHFLMVHKLMTWTTNFHWPDADFFWEYDPSPPSMRSTFSSWFAGWICFSKLFTN